MRKAMVFLLAVSLLGPALATTASASTPEFDSAGEAIQFANQVNVQTVIQIAALDPGASQTADQENTQALEQDADAEGDGPTVQVGSQASFLTIVQVAAASPDAFQSAEQGSEQAIEQDAQGGDAIQVGEQLGNEQTIQLNVLSPGATQLADQDNVQDIAQDADASDDELGDAATAFQAGTQANDQATVQTATGDGLDLDTCGCANLLTGEGDANGEAVQDAEQDTLQTLGQEAAGEEFVTQIGNQDSSEDADQLALLDGEDALQTADQSSDSVLDQLATAEDEEALIDCGCLALDEAETDADQSASQDTQLAVDQTADLDGGEEIALEECGCLGELAGEEPTATQSATQDGNQDLGQDAQVDGDVDQTSDAVLEALANQQAET